MKRFKHDDSCWTGDSDNHVPEGLGTLVKHDANIGTYVAFDGLMHNGRYVSGKLFKVLGETIYLAFEGTFSGDGSQYDSSGNLLFEGPFLNGRPHGFGYGTVHIHGILCDFSGTMDPLYGSGRLSYDGSVYTGDLHPLFGTPSGHGIFRDGPDICLEGDFDSSGSMIHLVGKGPFRDYVDDSFPEVHFVNGSFSIFAFHVALHGLCAVVFQSGQDLFKLVGTFENDTLGQSFDVYKIEDTDDVFTTSSLRTGRLVASVERSPVEPTHIDLYDGSDLSYSGRGVFLLESSYSEFFPHGVGTRYQNGKPSLIASFEVGDVSELFAVFDKDGDLLFRKDPEDSHPCPVLHGYGTVFAKDGSILYRTTFQNGLFSNLDKVLQTLPTKPISDVVDPITKESVPKGRLVLKLDSDFYAKTTLEAFWASHGSCVDPVYKTYALRFEKYKVV